MFVDLTARNVHDNDSGYLHNIVVQFALSSICGRPADQGKQDALTILTHKHDEEESESGQS